MAGKFNEQEKEYIRSKLLEHGRQLFGDLGLKKTSISDLTRQVNIAQGSFYLFYESKEELYFEILEQEEEYIREELLHKILLKEKVTRETFRHFLQQALQFLDESPIIKQLFDKSTMEQLLRKLPYKKLESNHQGDIDFLVPYIEKWQADGVMKQLEPDIIVSMIRSLVILSLQKEMIGERNYKATMNQFITMIAEDLVND
ncbi:TetR/AcrR family transcriptional regulator [Oceanobacillus sp. M60]|uniref:TetR/AcrR family transcriptional regulator n=1 Tax=Oceanobacillus oncorhynchi TaxID=545501 RepID=UPI002116D3DE|nr:TetR/AcrR family transcriptional regulator [Oceanobacillus oncorhynchi]UUI41727.1 TetR/AcrR family transcriptional regulator [Oceanobacillus oncorhynchi]